MKKNNLLSTLEKEEKEIRRLENKIADLSDKLLEKRPPHFSKADIINAVFGSLILGFAFILKGGMLGVAEVLSAYNLILIVITTIIILIAQIYYIGYVKVREKRKRRPGQFILKRLAALYIITILVSFFLVYILGVNKLVGNFVEVFKIVILVSMPCAIGAAVPSMLKRF